MTCCKGETNGVDELEGRRDVELEGRPNPRPRRPRERERANLREGAGGRCRHGRIGGGLPRPGVISETEAETTPEPKQLRKHPAAAAEGGGAGRGPEER
eukprot:4959214-Pyramimonas_sp.AAC.1